MKLINCRTCLLLSQTKKNFKQTMFNSTLLLANFMRVHTVIETAVYAQTVDLLSLSFLFSYASSTAISFVKQRQPIIIDLCTFRVICMLVAHRPLKTKEKETPVSI